MTYYPELPPLSLHEQNTRHLADATNEPFITVGQFDQDHYISEHGIITSAANDTFYYSLDGNEVSRAVPSDEVILVGYDAIDAYTNSLFDKAEEDQGIHYAVIALAVIDHFPEYFPKVPSVIYDEVADSIANPRAKKNDNVSIAEALLSAPHELRRRLLPELVARATRCKTLRNVENDPFLLAYTVTASQQYGISEMAVLEDLLKHSDDHNYLLLQ